MADIITSILSKVAEYLVSPIGCQLGYLFNYHSNVENLKNQIEKLGDVRGRVEQDAHAAWRNGDEIEPDVEKWLKSVNGIIEEAGKFLDDEDKAKRRCFNSLCPNLKLHYQLSKRAKKTAEKVVKFQDDGKFNKVSYRAPPQVIGSMAVKGYEAFESRMSVLEGIMEGLRNPYINMIGVYGMGGVGKTVLVKEVARKAKKYKFFNEVVMVVVSQPPNIRKIQEEIAYPLGLRFDAQEIDFERADRLCGRLKKEKSILVILDDVWARLDLEAIGIPSEDVHKGCKIVITSRSQDVLSNEMNTQKNFGIGVLLEEEAWGLFRKMGGDSVEAPHLKPTAMKVAKECAGLPIAITVLANTLKNKGLPVWKDALLRLSLSALTSIKEMDAKVYKSLKLSYDYLDSEEAKSLFLLSSLLPEAYQVSTEDFLKYGKGLGLFQGMDTLENARNRVHTLVDHLKATCLLLDGSASGFVRMHDVVRDVGISVASNEKHMLVVRNSVELEEWTVEEKLRICPAISFPFSDIRELSSSLDCPELKFLLFFNNDHSLKIPDTFFEGMKQLKALILTNVSFSSLPPSFHFLSNLQTLCLDQCLLQDITIIGELKKLEILSFRNADIKELPREIGQLTRLKLLDLSKCSKLKVIPSNIISSLSQLEELYMGESFVEWEVDGNASLVEFNHLSRLVALYIHIPNLKILSEVLDFGKLIRFKICVGYVNFYIEQVETSETSRLELHRPASMDLVVGRNMLSKRTDQLYLDGLNGLEGITSVLYGLAGQGFPDLKHFIVRNNSEIGYLINTVERFLHSAFPNLESMVLSSLINLKGICHGQFPADSFCNLRKVEVEDCDRLKSLFSLFVAKRLLQLQEMEIKACNMMEAIVTEGTQRAERNNEEMDMIMFPQLISLKLENLPKLMSFCSKEKINYAPTTDAGSQEIISEGKHDVPLRLFNEKVAFPNLEELVIRSVSLKEIWHSQLPVDSFRELKYLKVYRAVNLLNIIPFTMLMKLQNVISLEVWYSSSLEYIFDLEGLNDTERHVVRGIQLSRLYLYDLPDLMQIWKQDSPGIFPFQNLTSLYVGRCHHLRNIFTASMAKHLVQLQQFSVTFCHMMEEIIEKEGVEETSPDEIVFPCVTFLELKDLPNLASFCPDNNALSFPLLKEVSVEECPKLKTFSNNILSTPKLEKVQVKKDKWLWKGDFNATIQHLCMQKNVQVSEEN